MSDLVNSVLKALDSAAETSNIFTQNPVQPEVKVETPTEVKPETKEAE